MISAQFPEHLAWYQASASTCKYSRCCCSIFLKIYTVEFLPQDMPTRYPDPGILEKSKNEIVSGKCKISRVP